MLAFNFGLFLHLISVWKLLYYSSVQYISEDPEQEKEQRQKLFVRLEIPADIKAVFFGNNQLANELM